MHSAISEVEFNKDIRKLIPPFRSSLELEGVWSGSGVSWASLE